MVRKHMKKFIFLLLVIGVFFSAVYRTTASAGATASISGTDPVQAGQTYTYNVSVSANAFALMAVVSCDGVFSGSNSTCHADADSTSGLNENITASCSITVTVAAGAQPGDTGTIRVEYQFSTVSISDGTTVEGHSDSATKTVSVAAAASPSPSVSPSPSPSPSPSVSAKPKTTASASPSPSPSPSPSKTPEPPQWEVAASNVSAMQSGGTVHMDITESTQIPVSLLRALYEKQGVLEIDFGDFTCRVDGRTPGTIPGDITFIDLGFSMETDETLSQAVSGADAYQLHFAHEGQFPGVFTYTFKAERNEPGDTLYLYYYYDEAGVAEGKATAVVGQDGFVSFAIYHCSSYFVSNAILEDSVNQLVEANAAPSEEVDTGNEEESVVNVLQPTILPTAEEDEILGLPIVSLVAIVLAAAMFSMVLTMLAFRVGVFKKKQMSVYSLEADWKEEDMDEDAEEREERE